MKKICTILCVLFSIASCYSQGKKIKLSDNNYIRFIPGSAYSDFRRIELFSDIDTTWAKWKLRGYNFGFDPASTPMYTTINGIISTPFMVQVRGNENEKNMKRWGFHCSSLSDLVLH